MTLFGIDWSPGALWLAVALALAIFFLQGYADLLVDSVKRCFVLALSKQFSLNLPF